jgi:hypothetical protein
MKKTTFFAVLSLLTTGAFSQSVSAPGSVLSASGGRYVFGQVSEARRDQYLLDTQTGRLWRPVCMSYDKDDSKKCTGTVMEPMEFLDAKGNLAGAMPSSGK